MSRRAGLALAVWLLPVAAWAQAPEPAPLLDTDRSRAAIEVDLRVGGRVKGRFGRLEGGLERLPDGSLRVDVRLDAHGLVLDGPEWMERSMRSPRFLDVEAHPWIEFRSAPFGRDLVESGGTMAGELELREVRRPVRFRVDPEGCDAPGYDCDIHVSGEVSRREFGMDAYRMWLRDEVVFDFRVRLRQPDAP